MEHLQEWFARRKAVREPALARLDAAIDSGESRA
jgi:hypothetical protein